MCDRLHHTDSFANVVRCCAVLAAVLAAAGCSKQETPPPAPAEVKVLKLEPRDTPVTFEYIAQTQSPQQVNIVARVNGSLDKQLYTEGAIVKEGQLLFQMDQQAALINYTLVIQTAFADVENTLVTNQKTGEQVTAEIRRVQALSENARLAMLQYNGGYTDYLTVLNAQQQLFPAELNYAQNLGRVYSSLVNVYKAMGGGWVSEADKLTSQTMPPLR